MACAAGVGWTGRKKGRFSPLPSASPALDFPPAMLDIYEQNLDSQCQKGDLLFEINRTHEFLSFPVKTFYDKIQTEKPYLQGQSLK